MKKIHRRKPFLFTICIAFSTALFLIHSPTSISKMDSSAHLVEKNYTKSTVEMASRTEAVVEKNEIQDFSIPTLSVVSRGTDRKPYVIAEKIANNKTESVSPSGDENFDLNDNQPSILDQPDTSDSPSILEEDDISEGKDAISDEKDTISEEKDTMSEGKDANFNEDSVDLLARLITAEAQGEPFDAQVAVGAVVINRVKSGVWASTITDVIYQNINGYYQFTPVENGWINKPADPESIKAAKAALNGVDPTNGAQFYYDDKSTNKWILSKPVSIQIGHMIYAFN